MNSFHTSPDLFLNLNNPHPLIPRENTYNLSRKLLTVHANDRDRLYYPNSNEFSIKCPQPYINIQSMRLSEISFPNSMYNFSKKLKNNKFSINSISKPAKNIEIPDGFYTPDLLATTMTNKILENDISNKFLVIYNPIEEKFIIISNNKFILHNYENTTDCSVNTTHTYKYKQPIDKKSVNTIQLKFDFLYTLGFDSEPDGKFEYIEPLEGNLFDGSLNKLIYWKQDYTHPNFNSNIYYIKAKSITRFRNTQPIYFEIDKLNMYDELNPYPRGSTNLYNNYSNGSTDTAFFKIPPPLNDNNSKGYSKMLDNINNVICFFDQPLQRLQNLSFKFRYHDGCLVDFNNQDVNFTLEINQLRNEIPKHLNIRTPAL